MARRAQRRTKARRLRPPHSYHHLQEDTWQRLRSDRSALGPSAPAGPQLTPANTLHWQRTVGNQVVSRLLQRQARPTTIQREEPEPTDLDDRSLEELDAELDALLNELFGPTPQVPAFEAIASTTAGEFSRGELEQEIQQAWTREQLSFTEAARRAAQTDVGDESRPRAVASPQMASAEDFGQRWSLNLYAADYEEGSDLGDVARLARQGSPFRQAIQAEFNREIPVNNPSGSQMRDAITGAVFDLWLALAEGQMGQLVVTFSGHGGNGWISGVDGEQLSPMDMRDLAEFAQGWNVHIVYILDTCRAGVLSQYAQAAISQDVRQRMEEMPAEQRQPIQDILDLASPLGHLGFDLNQSTIAIGDAGRDYRRRRNTANFQVLFQALNGLSDNVNRLGDMLDNDELPWDQVGNVDQLRQLVPRLLLDILYAFGGNRRYVNDVLRRAAVLLDTLNDSVNELVSRVHQLSAAGGQGQAGAGSSR